MFGNRDCICGIRVHDVLAERGELVILILFLGARQQDGHDRLRVGVVWQKLDVRPIFRRQTRLHQFRQLLLHERKLNARAEVRLLGEHPYLQPLRQIAVRHHDLREHKRVLALPINQQALFQLLSQILDPATIKDFQRHSIIAPSLFQIAYRPSHQSNAIGDLQGDRATLYDAIRNCLTLRILVYEYYTLSAVSGQAGSH